MSLFEVISKALYGEKLPEDEQPEEVSSWHYICPNCHSDDLTLSQYWDGGVEFAAIEISVMCNTCGHRFTQIYKFSHLEE